MAPGRRFAGRWPAYAVDPGVDYAAEPTTLVTCTLDDAEGGTRLAVVESGFDAPPAPRRAAAFRANDRGWAGQLQNVRRHPEGRPAGVA